MEPALMVAVKLAVEVVFPGKEGAGLGGSTILHQYLGWILPQRGSSPGATAAILIIAAIPFIMLLRGIIAYMNIYFLQWVSVRAITDLRTRLFSHLLSLDLAFLSKHSTGEILSRVSSDITMLQNTLTSSIATIIRDPAVLIGLAALLFWKQPTLTFISLLVLPLCIIPVAVYGRKVRHSSAAIQNHFAQLTKIMHETFTGSRVIKAYNLESTAIRQFQQLSGKFIGHYMRVVRSIEIPSPLIEFLGSVGVALIFYYILLFAKTRMSAGDFFLFIGSIFSMYRPLKNLTRVHNQLEQARAATERVFELLETRSSLAEPEHPVQMDAHGIDIHFEHIDFHYGEKPVLRDFNLVVKAGSLVALVGSSGAGKTTVTNLLLRFYDPQKGAVRIGSTDIRQVATTDLRRQIAVVAQETILFDDTIGNNIALGRPGAAEPEIQAAAKHAFAHDFIMEKEGGYAAMIGEKGVALSGGQRQRIAIARAILKNAPILVLDEATSSLDTEAERAVQGALEGLMQGRTTICIAHRLSTVQRADMIVVMQEGQIKEQGTHIELLKRDGLYKKLYELQFQ
jgi:subfamily B ATP-binding cassette protein MsbA